MIQTQKNFEEIMMKTNNHFANNITAFKFPKIKNEHNSTRSKSLFNQRDQVRICQS